MTDFRALCAELHAALDRHDLTLAEDQLLDRSAAALRAALADGPAVPDGREPASVTGQPSDEAWDALVERAWDKYQTVGYQGERFIYDRDFDNALEFVRQGLARWGNPAPQPPAEAEVAELVRLLGSMAAEAELADQVHDASVLDRAAELLQRLSPPQPVPVSERLQQMEDLAADAVAGLRYIEQSHGRLYGVGWDRVYKKADRLKPAHALPVPGQEVEG